MIRLPFFSVVVSLIFVPFLAAEQIVPPSRCQPNAADFTLLWWANGPEGRTKIDYSRPVDGIDFSPKTDAFVKKDRRLRCIQSGFHAFVLDVETLELIRQGYFEESTPFTAALFETNTSLFNAAGIADLELSIIVRGKKYYADRSGVSEKDFSACRVIESGRLVQRFDVQGIKFKDDLGNFLEDGVGRFEVLAWPNRQVLTLEVEQVKLEPKVKKDGKEVEEQKPWRMGSLRLAYNSKDKRKSRQSSTPHSFEKIGVRKNVRCDIANESDTSSFVKVEAVDSLKGNKLPSNFDWTYFAYGVDLDGAFRFPSPADRPGDYIERVLVKVRNTSRNETAVPLVFKKSSKSFKNAPLGCGITGISAVIRDRDGLPTGIPVQLSKNWHGEQSDADPLQGIWFRAFTTLRMPPQSETEFEISIAYGYWGGVPAASHAQLSLIGWGSNQLWEEAALGSWGESICFEPDKAQGDAAVLDVRPLMVWQMDADEKKKWGWTNNVGGADFLVLQGSDAKRIPNGPMKTYRIASGPCLTETVYTGKTADGKIDQTVVASLYRTDDCTRGIFRVKYSVKERIDFKRLVFFQAGADHYSYTGEKKFAVGNETGLAKEWDTKWGGDGANQENAVNRTEPLQLSGLIPWISMHDGVSRDKTGVGAWANRGMVVRRWVATLDGKPALPWMVERGAKVRGVPTSLVDIVPPPGVTKLEPGDSVEAEFELVVVPQKSDDYYGPNESLRRALEKDGNSWKMIQREAVGNALKVDATLGTITRIFPLNIKVDSSGSGKEFAKFTVRGGVGYVPFCFTGLAQHGPFELVEIADGKEIAVDQSVFGNDFWQADYDASTETYRIVYTVPLDTEDDKLKERAFVFRKR